MAFQLATMLCARLHHNMDNQGMCMAPITTGIIELCAWLYHKMDIQAMCTAPSQQGYTGITKYTSSVQNFSRIYA